MGLTTGAHPEAPKAMNAAAIKALFILTREIMFNKDS